MDPILNMLTNTIEVMGTTSHCEEFLSRPNDLAVTLYKNGSWMENLGARALSIVQVIVSIVAVPLALLAMIFVPAITLFTHDKMTARAYANACGGLAAAHLFRIPESLVGVIFPSTLIKSAETQVKDLVGRDNIQRLKDFVQLIGQADNRQQLQGFMQQQEGNIQQLVGLVAQIVGGFMQAMGQQNR